MYNFACYKSNSQLENYQTYLFIGPHPSDIDIACGGLVSKLIAAEKTVHYLICTNGWYSAVKPGMTIEDMVYSRRMEAKRAADFLKVNTVTFLDYANGGMHNFEDLKLSIANEIVRVNPDVIVSPDFANTTDLNPDHISVAQAVKQMVIPIMSKTLSELQGIKGTANPRMIALYWCDNPNTYIDITDYINNRFGALAHHTGLFPVSPGDDVSFEFEYVKEKCLKELRLSGDVSGNTYAEGYRVISKNGEGGYAAFNVHPIFNK